MLVAIALKNHTRSVTFVLICEITLSLCLVDVNIFKFHPEMLLLELLKHLSNEFHFLNA